MGSGSLPRRHRNDLERWGWRLRHLDWTTNRRVGATADDAAVIGKTAIDGADTAGGQTHGGFSLRKKWGDAAGVSGIGPGGLGAAYGNSAQKEAGLVDEVEEFVFAVGAIKLLFGEVRITRFERQHVPDLAKTVENVDGS